MTVAEKLHKALLVFCFKPLECTLSFNFFEKRKQFHSTGLLRGIKPSAFRLQKFGWCDPKLSAGFNESSLNLSNHK